MLELPITAPDLTVTEAIVDDEAIDVLEREPPGERAADVRVGKIWTIGSLERALEALPAQRVSPQHVERVLW